MPDELLDIYDETNTAIIGQAMKSEAHREGLWHRAVHIWVYNKAGKILLQKRAAVKALAPNKWDAAAAGHIAVGEDSRVAGVREMAEEIGIHAEAEDLVFVAHTKHQQIAPGLKQYEFYEIYAFEYNGDITTLPLQETEVSALKWFTADELREGLKNTPEAFTAQGEYWEKMIETVAELTVMSK